MAEIVYVWAGTTLTARVVVSNPQPLPMVCDVHLTIASKPERVNSGVTIPANTAVTMDFTGYTFTTAGIYPAGGYVCAPENTSIVYAAIVAQHNLQVLESQLVATVDWV